MVKTTSFKKLSVDTNIVIGLALLYLRGEKEFIDTNIASGGNKITIKQYAEDLKYLQHCIDKHHIQVIITPQVMYELNFRAKEVDSHGNKIELEKETIVLQNLKNLALEYLQRMPKIKIAQIPTNQQDKFITFTERLVIEYVDTFKIFLRNLMGNIPSDARIIAQTTALAVDFISRDNHFHNKNPYEKHSKAEKLAMTNKNLGGHPTKVIALCDLESEMTNIGTRGGLIAKKHFEENKSAVKFNLSSYAEYLDNKQLGR